MTLATNPDAMGVVFVFVWTGLCVAAAHAWTVISTRAHGGSEC